MGTEEKTTLRQDIESAINRASAENGSDTPDHILADFLIGCLTAFDVATCRRDAWHGFKPFPENENSEVKRVDERCCC